MAKNKQTKPEIIIGYHRSSDLAERHRRQLERDTDSDVTIIARRNSRGQYSSHGHTFEFEISKPRVMWRVTVAAPYYRRHGKKKSSYHAAAFMVRGWYSTKRQAEAAVSELRERAKTGRAAFIESDNRSWGLKTTDVEITNVEFDPRFIGIIEERNEK